MTEQHATPAPLIQLRLLRGDTVAPDTGGDTGATQEPVPVSGAAPDTADAEGDTAPMPVSGAEVVPLTVPERARLTVGHWASTVTELWGQPGQYGHTLWHGRPGSLADRRAYVKSRGWVPKELDGKAAGMVTAAGIVFHAVAALIKVPLLILYAALDRPLRLAGLAAFIAVLVFVIVPHIPHL